MNTELLIVLLSIFFIVCVNHIINDKITKVEDIEFDKTKKVKKTRRQKIIENSNF